MKMKLTKLTFVLLGTIIIASCSTSNEKLKEQITTVLKNNPTILTATIESHPSEFIASLQKAAKIAQEEIGKKREEDEKTKLQEYFTNPLVANIRKDESMRGEKNAPITLIEYSDFECPYCSRGFETVQELLKKYAGKIRFIYKHLPLSFHEQAMLSAKYYESIRLQDEKKAFAFHDAIFKNQPKLKNGVSFLDSLAKQLNVDMPRLKKDLNSNAVAMRISADIKEAETFGMQGTPGFLLNGIPVKGAYPVDYFVSLINELKGKGKLHF